MGVTTHLVIPSGIWYSCIKRAEGLIYFLAVHGGGRAQRRVATEAKTTMKKCEAIDLQNKMMRWNPKLGRMRAAHRSDQSTG